MIEALTNAIESPQAMMPSVSLYDDNYNLVDIFD